MNFFKQLQSIIPIVEEYLQGELTWGFEFEGITTDNKSDLDDFVDDYWNTGSDQKLNLDTIYGIGSYAKVTDDSSIDGEDIYAAKINCQECNGSGSLDCYSCDATGLTDCTFCDANGKVDCPECDGVGEIDGENCPECDGSGEEDCPECDGSGSITCDDCGGYGESQCGECGGRGISLDDPGFEIVSPIMQLTPQNIQRTVLFFQQLTEKFYIKTNDTCGFHVHFGLPGRTSREIDFAAIWIKLFLSFHPNILNEIINIDFYNDEYADPTVFNDTEHNFYNNIKTMSLEDAIKIAIEQIGGNNKYHLFHRHTQYGTLEWRGPRGMFDNIEPRIYNFLKKDLIKTVKIIRNILSQQSFEIVNGEEYVSIFQRDIWNIFKGLSYELARSNRGTFSNRTPEGIATKSVAEFIKIPKHLQRRLYKKGNKFYNLSILYENNNITIKNGYWESGVFDFILNSNGVLTYNVTNSIWGPNAKFIKGYLEFDLKEGSYDIYIEHEISNNIMTNLQKIAEETFNEGATDQEEFANKMRDKLINKV